MITNSNRAFWLFIKDPNPVCTLHSGPSFQHYLLQMSPSHTSSQAARLSPTRVPLSPAGRDIQDSANIADSNPIGALQEMCMKHSWTPPSYDLARETGESHMKTFIYECKVSRKHQIREDKIE